jgi:hypothetical protein
MISDALVIFVMFLVTLFPSRGRHLKVSTPLPLAVRRGVVGCKHLSLHVIQCRDRAGDLGCRLLDVLSQFEILQGLPAGAATLQAASSASGQKAGPPRNARPSASAKCGHGGPPRPRCDAPQGPPPSRQGHLASSSK